MNKKILLHYHIFYIKPTLYYLEFLKIIVDKFKNDFDIIITISNYEESILIDIKNFFSKYEFENYKIISVNNIGADIAPIFYIFENNIVNIDDYFALIHIHTKNPIKYTNFNELKILWGNELIKNLFNMEYKIKYLKFLFEKNYIGIAGSDKLFLNTDNNYKNNEFYMNQLCKDLDINNNFIENSKFIAGNMWWCNINIIKLLCTKIKYSDFKNEFAPDGNLEHSIERFFGIISNYLGYKYCLLTPYEIKVL